MRTTYPLDSLQRHFFSWGWLLIAILPLAQTVGRGVFNVLGVGLLAWGWLSMSLGRRPPDWIAVLLFAAMVASFGVSAALAENPGVAFARLRTFLLYGLLCWPVLAAIRTEQDLQRMINAFAASAVAIILLLWALYLVKFRDPAFLPERDMREDNLPLLLPLLTYATRKALPRQHLLVAIPLIALATIYVILSNGRAALLGLLVGLSVFVVLVSGVRRRTVLLLPILVLGVAWAIRGEHLLRNGTVDGDLVQAINKFSSFRLELWRNALNHPPENALFGSGMGNIPGVVLAVSEVPNANLKHLHNFLFDCWYENGLAGLAALLLFLGYGFLNALTLIRRDHSELREMTATIIAASTAIIAGAALSFSYASRQFAIYLFLFLHAATALRMRMPRTTSS